MPNDYTALLSGSYWSGIEVTGKPTIVTYSFPTTAPGYDATINDPNLTPTALASFSAFSATEAQMARDALAEWGNASGLIFIEVAPGQGDINFQKLDFSGTGYDGAGGIAYRPFGGWDYSTYPYFNSDLDSSGDVFMNSDIPVTYGTLLHEVGHALGLKHPTEVWTDYAANPPVVHPVWDADDPNLTIMSQLPSANSHLTAMDRQAIAAIYGTQAQDGKQVASWSWDNATQTLTQNGFTTADAIRGSSVKDVIYGNNGDDRLYGLNGNDTLVGGLGNDTLDGGPGDDSLNGGSGDDLYIVNSSGDRTGESLNKGYDRVFSTVSVTLSANVEELDLFGATRLVGIGNALDNTMFAGIGGHQLKGMAGNDYMVGGAGRDSLDGGSGADVMWGGAGGDYFVFTYLTDFTSGPALDTIGDFSRAENDKIHLRAVDPDPITAGDQAFTFIGTAAFTTDANFQVRYSVQGSNRVVEIDINHDRVTDYSILLYGTAALGAQDFLL